MWVFGSFIPVFVHPLHLFIPKVESHKTNKAWQQTKLINKTTLRESREKIKSGVYEQWAYKRGASFHNIAPFYQQKMSMWTNPKKRKREENITKGSTLSALSQSMSLKIFSFVAFGKQQEIHVTTLINPCYSNFDNSNNSIPHYSKSWSNFSLVLLG